MRYRHNEAHGKRGKGRKNHPEITVITPVMRYTALSRPQALSAREEPIATMNVTYVVERGSRRDVAREISRAATVNPRKRE